VGRRSSCESAKTKAGRRPGLIRYASKNFVWLSFTELKLDFCVGVRADFAVQIDFFVLRCGPFHGYDSLALVEHRKNNTETEQLKAEFKQASSDADLGTRATNSKRKHAATPRESQ
jgi:hypothetical protein